MYIVNIRGTIRRKQSNYMKLHMNWSINFKKGRLKLKVEN